MNVQHELNLEIVDWGAAQARVMPLRMQVFVVEQGVPAELELDAFDALSRHALALNAGGKVEVHSRVGKGTIFRLTFNFREREPNP